MLTHDARLAAYSRLAPVGSRVAATPVAGLLLLVGCGIAAGAATALLDFGLRIPGHAVLRAVVPLAFGLSLVPRRGGATLMAVAAAVTVVGLGGGHLAAGPGAVTSLVLLGPLLDTALRRVERGLSVLLAFAFAGLGANVIAFTIRLVDKIVAPHGARPLAVWWPGAVASYLVCGVLAGAVASALFFRLAARPADAARDGRS